MKGIVRLVNVDDMYNILKSLLAPGYWSRHEGGIEWSKLLLELKSDLLHYGWKPYKFQEVLVSCEIAI